MGLAELVLQVGGYPHRAQRALLREEGVRVEHPLEAPPQTGASFQWREGIWLSKPARARIAGIRPSSLSSPPLASSPAKWFIDALNRRVFLCFGGMGFPRQPPKKGLETSRYE